MEPSTGLRPSGSEPMLSALPAVALFVLPVAFVVALGRGAAAGDRTRQEAYRRWLEERGRETDSPPFTGPRSTTATRSRLSR